MRAFAKMIYRRIFRKKYVGFYFNYLFGISTSDTEHIITDIIQTLTLSSQLKKVATN